MGNKSKFLLTQICLPPLASTPEAPLFLPFPASTQHHSLLSLCEWASHTSPWPPLSTRAAMFCFCCFSFFDFVVLFYGLQSLCIFVLFTCCEDLFNQRSFLLIDGSEPIVNSASFLSVAFNWLSLQKTSSRPAFWPASELALCGLFIGFQPKIQRTMPFFFDIFPNLLYLF